MTYTTIKHPVSGETYAVEIDDQCDLVRAAGPLHHTDSTDADTIQARLDNQLAEDTRDDADWLREALNAARGL